MEAVNPNILQKVMESLNRKPRKTNVPIKDEVVDVITKKDDYNNLLLSHERSLKQEYADKIVHIHDSASKQNKTKDNNSITEYVNPLLLKIKTITNDTLKFLNKIETSDGYTPKKEISKTVKSLLESTTSLTSEAIKTELIKSPVGRNYFSKKAIADTISDKVVKYSNIAFNLSKKIAASGIDGITWLLQSSWKVLKSLFSVFVNKPVTMVITGIDTLLGKLFGNYWSVIKKVTTNVIIKPVTWFIKLGFTAIEYIWTGLKTIFSIGMDVIYKVVDIVGYGLKKLFKFSVKLITSTIMTLFNPLTWLALIPLLLLGGELVMDVLSTALIGGAFIGEIAIEGLKITGTIISFLWDGVKKFFDNVDNVTGFSGWISTIFNFLSDSVTSLLVSIFGKDKIDKFFKITNEVLSYFIDLGKTGINYIQTMINDTISVFNEIDETPGGLTVYVLDKLSQYEATGFASPLINGYMKGVIRKVHAMLGFKYTSNVRAIDTLLQTQKNSLVTDMLQNYYVSMSKEGLSEAEITTRLSKDIIPLLSSTYKKPIESFSKQYVGIAIKKAKGYMQSGKGAITQDLLNSSMMTINRAEAIKQLIISGKIDASSDQTNALIETLKQNQFDVESKRTKVFTGINKGIETTVANLDQYNNNFRISLQDYKTQINKKLNNMPISKLSAFSDALSHTFSLVGAAWDTMDDSNDDTRAKGVAKLVNWSDVSRDSISQDSIMALPSPILPQINVTNTTTPKKMADGAVIDRNDIIMKLDADSIKYVRNQIKQLDITPKEDEVTNITNIHKTSTITMQTHQLYTLKQLSRGILI